MKPNNEKVGRNIKPIDASKRYHACHPIVGCYLYDDFALANYAGGHSYWHKYYHCCGFVNAGDIYQIAVRVFCISRGSSDHNHL